MTTSVTGSSHQPPPTPGGRGRVRRRTLDGRLASAGLAILLVAAGKEALDAVAALACTLDLEAGAYGLLHDLRDAGLVFATADRPPRYAITVAGRRQAERLAARCRPDIRDALVELNACPGCRLSPRDDAETRPG